MAAFDFPNTPAIGNTANGYVWDGQKWAGGGNSGITQTDADARYVNVTGDIMSGNLSINSPTTNAIFGFSSPDGSGNAIRSAKDGISRWEMQLATTAPNIGGNAGSDFSILRLDDSGAILGEALHINRASGAWTINGTVNAITPGATSSGAYFFGTFANNKYLYYDGSATFHFSAGDNLAVEGAITSAISATLGTYYFGTSGTKAFGYDGASYILNGGPLNVSSNIIANGGSFTSIISGVGGTYLFGNTGNKYLTFDGSNFTLGTAGQLIIASGEPTGTTSAATKKYVDTRIGAIRAMALIDIFGGYGVSLGISGVNDAGIGYCDVVYNFAFSSLTAHIPVLSIYPGAAGTNCSCNVNNPAPSSVRLVSIVATTAALVDPQYYVFHAAGS